MDIPVSHSEQIIQQERILFILLRTEQGDLDLLRKNGNTLGVNLLLLSPKLLLDIICLSIYLFQFTFVHQGPLLVMSQVTYKTHGGALHIKCERKKHSRCIQDLLCILM